MLFKLRGPKEQPCSLLPLLPASFLPLTPVRKGYPCLGTSCDLEGDELEVTEQKVKPAGKEINYFSF